MLHACAKVKFVACKMIAIIVLLISYTIQCYANAFPFSFSFSFFFREAKLAYKAEVVELQKQLRRQHSQFDLLVGQLSALIQGRRARVAVASAVNGELIVLDEKLSARNLEVDTSL